MGTEKEAVIARLQLIGAMVIFGTIGIFVKYISLPSAVIACARGIVGMLFLLLVLLVQKKRPSRQDIGRNGWILCLSGAAIGMNWVLLFESYRYTTVATATLCYYLAPLFVILASPLVLKEKLTVRKLCCVGVALLGMVFVSGVWKTGFSSVSELTGVFFGVGAAMLYATVMLLNKKLHEISSYDRTIVQLGMAAVITIPYILLVEDVSAISLEPRGLLLLIVVAVFHTGIAYALYFGSMKDLKAQTVAILSYLDPVVAILLSVLVLREGMDVQGIIGAMLILGSALISEMPEKRKLHT